MKFNKITQKQSHQVGQDKPTEGKRLLKRRHRNQRPTTSHTQKSHENTKVKGIKYMPRACCRPG